MRIIAFIFLIVLATLVPWPLLLAGAVLYALKWTGYELLVLGALIDAYYGIGAVIPYYTLVALGLVVAIEKIKPHLLVYNEEYRT